VRWFGGRKTPKYLAVCEYWVYLPLPKLPPQNAIMTAMLNGWARAAEPMPAIAPSEALIFSDIRLHIALVLREKNPHLFRPDLFETHIEPTPQILEGLGAAQALAKVRFLSEDPVTEWRHLQVVPRLAATIADMGASSVVFDCVAERLQTAEQLRSDICKTGDTDTPDFHVRVVWMPNDVGGRACTRGLAKVGLPELITPDTRGDHQSIVCEVLDLAAAALWKDRRILDTLTLTCYDDTFVVKIEPGRKGPLLARILRVSDS
jgi:hypothetical protein